MEVQRGQHSAPRRDSRDVGVEPGRLALIVVAESGTVLLADGQAIETLGANVESIGQPARVVLARFPRLITAVDAAIAGQRSSVPLPANGRTFDVRVEPRRGGGAILAAIDVTRQERPEAVDRESHRDIALVFRQVPGAVWSTDRDLVITRAFGRLARRLGLDAHEVVAKSLYDVLGTRDPDDALTDAHRAALGGKGTSYRYSFRGRRFDVITEPLRDAENRIVGTVSAAVDITSVVESEERLAKSQAILADAQRVAHVGSWEWDIVENAITWSDEMFSIYGLERGRFAASLEGFLERVAAEDAALTKETIASALQKPGPFVYDHRIVRPDGSVRMLHTRGEVLTDTGGKPIRMLGTCWDITERWETGRALERTASLLQATIEATVDGIFVVDIQGRITAYNQRFLEMWSVPPQLVRDGDDKALRAYVLDQLENPAEFLRSVSELDASPEKESFDVLRFRDGRVFERIARPQRIGAEVVGRVWSFRDITDRERLYRRAVFLADAARLLGSLDVEQALPSVAHLAVPYLGDSCAIDLLGEGAPRRLQAVSRDPRRAITPELSPAVVAGRASIYAVSAVAHMAVPLVVGGRVEGAVTFAAAMGRRYTASDLELANELAQRVSLALEKGHLLERAQEALRAREEFLAIAAHEIRGPVTTMHAAVQALLRKKLSEAATHRAFELIEREDRRLARFVDELLDLGLTRSEVASFELEEVSLARVVRDVVSRHEDELARSGSPLSLDLDERAVGHWNRSRIEKVVATLLSNATKFGLGKPIEVTLRVEQQRAVLRVRDHGIGIPGEAQERIFAPFERAVSVRHYGGLGLGLFIARSIVGTHGGRISVESQPGVGSLFTVDLPLGGNGT